MKKKTIVGGGGLDEKKNHWGGGESEIVGAPPPSHVFLNGIALSAITCLGYCHTYCGSCRSDRALAAYCPVALAWHGG